MHICFYEFNEFVSRVLYVILFQSVSLLSQNTENSIPNCNTTQLPQRPTLNSNQPNTPARK